MLHSYGDNQIFVGHSLAELDVLQKFVGDKPEREPGFHKDVFGNKARLDFFHDNGGHGVAQESLPFPDNGQYGEAIEYLGTLRGVQSAGESLVVYELGAGFAPWLVVANTFRKAFPHIKSARYVAVEADPERLSLTRQNFVDNGMPVPGDVYAGAETEVVNAAVADVPGELHFAAQGIHDWGGSLATAADGADYRGLSSKTVPVPARRIDDLIANEERVDLMHIDIQGWEAKSIAASLPAIHAKVASMVIGTHSRVIEGELLTMLRDDGWLLLYEKPCKFDCQNRVPDLVGATVYDGTQFWINLRLWPSKFDWS